MTGNEFMLSIKGLAQQIVDAVAKKEYGKLADFALIDSSWIKSGQTQEEAFEELGEWLDEQLAMWEEDEGRTYVIDLFDEQCLGNIELNGDKAFVEYSPTNSGEQLDLWFELDFSIETGGQIKVIFNVNI